jgi:hypothetical protein
MIRMPHASNLSSQQLLRLSEVASLHPGRRVVACFEEASLDPRLLNLVASLGQMNLVVHGVDANAFGSSVSSDHVVVDL